MGRMSARYVANKLGRSIAGVYKDWQDMGLVKKDSWGDWTLTELGRKKGGRMSSGSRLQVPTFDFDEIKKTMDEFKK